MSITSIWKESDGSWSWGRIAASVTLISAVWAFIHVVLKSGTIPDFSTLMGLASWATAPYFVNKGFTAFAKSGNL